MSEDEEAEDLWANDVQRDRDQEAEDDYWDTHPMEHYETLLEENANLCATRLYGSPEVIPEAIQDVKSILDDESEYDFLCAIVNAVEGEVKDTDNIIESHAKLMKLKQAFDVFVSAYARALTSEETGNYF